MWWCVNCKDFFVVGELPGPGERGTRHWVRRTNLVDSRTSVTDVKFGPKSQGLQLATCSAEGIIRIYEAPDVMNLSQWTLQHEVQSKLPCSCLSWNPSLNKLVEFCIFFKMLSIYNKIFFIEKFIPLKIFIYIYMQIIRFYSLCLTLFNFILY